MDRSKRIRHMENELKKLRDELRKAQAELANAAAGGVAAGQRAPDHVSEQATTATDSDALDAAVLQARDKLKKVQNLPEDLHGLVAGGYKECLARLQIDLDVAQAARRAANPLKEQLETAEFHKERMAKKLKEAHNTLDVQQKLLDDTVSRIENQRGIVAECELALRKAAAEVAELATKFATERTSASDQAPADAASLGGAPSGFVTIAYAEEKWAERERAFENQLAQLRAIVAATQCDDSAVSEADTLVVDSDAEGNTRLDEPPDDDGWQNASSTKKRTGLQRDKEALAKKVRHTLSKTVPLPSPFHKQ